MSKFSETLFSMLRGIDAEATRRPDGVPTGIRWYNGFVDPQLSLTAASRVEDLWSSRVAELYRERGLRADTQVCYPRSRQKCDLVITSPRGKRFWIEVKGAWTEYVYPTYSKSNPSFGKYLHSTADDIDKLAKLGPPEANDLGLLLLGYDRPGRAIEECHLNVIRARAPWKEECDGWDEQHWIGNRVRCWFWWTHLE